MDIRRGKYLSILSLLLFVAASPKVALADGKFKLVNGTNAICRVATQFLNNYNYSIEKNLVTELGKKSGSEEPFHLPSGMPATRLDDFDFDNDGIPDHVFSYDGVGSYIYGSVLFVAFGNSNEAPQQRNPPTVTEVKIFPCQFDPSVSSSSSCPMISQDADDAGIRVSFSKGKSVFFRGRYTFISPILIKERTYLVLHSASAETKHFAAVIEPTGGTKYRSTCLFKETAKKERTPRRP